MLTQNKFSNYLLYAIGEIILVVIGILIALQINTWNKEQQNLALERTSLENLKEDLIIQKEIILEQLDNEANMISKMDSCRLYLNASLPLEVMNKLLVELASRHTFVANKATFTNMGSTGNVVLIHEPELQNAIVRYYQQLDYTTAVINNNNLHLIDGHFGAFVAKNTLGFKLTKEGYMDSNYVMEPEQRFTLSSELDGRRKASSSIQRLCNLQLEATDQLIQLINQSLLH